MRRIILGVVAFGLVGVVLGWSQIAARAARLSPETDDLIAKRRPAPHYEQLFPRYVDLRATSQWRKQIGGRGNAFGHGLIYIKGACKAEDAAFPQLRRCEREAVSVDDPEQGVGVRVGRFFRNVNRVAVPAYDFFDNGNLDPGETLTQERLDETVNAAIAAGVVDGVDLHDGRGGEWTRGREAFVGQHSADTDFALTYARKVFCARVPVTEG